MSELIQNSVKNTFHTRYRKDKSLPVPSHIIKALSIETGDTIYIEIKDIINKKGISKMSANSQ